MIELTRSNKHYARICRNLRAIQRCAGVVLLECHVRTRRGDCPNTPRKRMHETLLTRALRVIPARLIGTLLRSKRVHPVEERSDGSGLHPNFSLPAEAHD